MFAKHPIVLYKKRILEKFGKKFEEMSRNLQDDFRNSMEVSEKFSELQAKSYVNYRVQLKCNPWSEYCTESEKSYKILRNCYNRGWKWPPSTSTHNFDCLTMFRKVRRSWRGAIAAISAWIRCFSSAIFASGCSKTLFLRWLHKKKSRGVRSGLLGTHNGRLTSHSPKNSHKNSIFSRAMCTRALSCWNTQSHSPSSRG